MRQFGAPRGPLNQRETARDIASVIVVNGFAPVFEPVEITAGPLGCSVTGPAVFLLPETRRP